MSFKPQPLFFGELGALPVIVARFVLRTKLDPPGLIESALTGSHMRLKFNRVSTGTGDGINKCVSHAQTPIMGLAYFTNDQTIGGRELFSGNI